MANKTDIVMLLDRTGSMRGMEEDVVGGVNTVIDEQKAAGNEGTLTLIKFDSKDRCEYAHNAVPISQVPEFMRSEYVPRGLTPLLDAMGMAIVDTEERINGLPKAERPDRILFVTYTDGEENASKDFDNAKLGKLVKRMKGKKRRPWEFMFLGADMDAFSQASKVGLSHASTVAVSRRKTLKAIQMAAKKAATYSVTGNAGDLGYTIAERKSLK